MDISSGRVSKNSSVCKVNSVPIQKVDANERSSAMVQSRVLAQEPKVACTVEILCLAGPDSAAFCKLEVACSAFSAERKEWKSCKGASGILIWTPSYSTPPGKQQQFEKPSPQKKRNTGHCSCGKKLLKFTTVG